MASIVNLCPRPIRSADADLALRRLAIQIVAQLPEAEEDALAALEYARQFVAAFLGSKPGVLPPAAL